MDKQTYEELISSTKQVISDFDGMESLIRYHIKDDYLPRSRRDFNNIVKFIESQKPLEIVGDGLYRIKLNLIVLDIRNNNSIFLPVGEEVRYIGSSFGEVRIIINDDIEKYIQVYIPSDQFNQHNFMKVEDK